MPDSLEGAAIAPFADSRDDPAAVGLDAERLARIGGWMRRYVGEGKLPYAMTVVARKGRIAYLDACGSGDPDNDPTGAGPEGAGPPVDHLARVFSMTKLVVTSAAMTLFEEGSLQLDDPIAEAIPAFAEPRVYVSGSYPGMVTEPAAEPITVRHLMTHTAGLTYGLFDETAVGDAYRDRDVNFGKRTASLAEMADLAASMPLCFQPGSQWRYSIATDILGRVVEVVAGKPLGEVLQERIFDPLGMADTGFGIAPEKASRLVACYQKTEDGGMKRIDGREDSVWQGRPAMQSGGGGLISTLPDYLRFLEMLRRGGGLDGTRVLGRKTVELMMRNHLPGDLASMGTPTFSEMPMVGLGFGLGGSVMLDPTRAQILASEGEFAWGGVASTGFWIDRAEEISVVFMTQLFPSSAWPLRRELRVLVNQALVD